MPRSLLTALLLLPLTAYVACGGDSDDDDDSSNNPDKPLVILDGGGGIEDPPDGASLCPSGECNYQTQEGCSAEQACWPGVVGEGELQPKCQTTSGTGINGTPCTEWFDCAPGYLCAAGACRKLCCGGDWTACPEGESCIRQLMVPAPQDPASAQVDLCFPTGGCDPLDPNACADQADRSCQLVDPTGAVACAPEGVGTVGDTCSPGEPCAAGFSCVGTTCRRLCRAVELEPGDPRPCPEAEGVCIHFDRNPQGVGECTPFENADAGAGDAG